MWRQEKAVPPKVVSKTSIEKTTRGLRFTLHDVEQAEQPLSEIPASAAFSNLIESTLDACSFEDEQDKFVLQSESVHPLIISALLSYAEHRPLVISPDAVWVTIAQGLGHHVNLDPEAYRAQLVDHEQGKKTIRVDIVSHCPHWPSVFEDFCKQLSKDQKGSRSAEWAQQKSTTGPIERAAFQVVLMDILKPYHNFIVLCICGIPSIELLGTAEDWRKIETRLTLLDELGLSWWSESLKPICHQFAEAAEGRIDLKHWSEIIKKESTYGRELIDGWLVKLVPYLGNVSGQTSHRNPLLIQPRSGECHGISLNSLPKGISQVPFLLVDEQGGTPCSKEFVAGLAGIQQNDNGALEARIGWAIRQRCGLSVALDELERRKLFEGPSAPIKFHCHDGMPSEVIEIQDRCNGARLCTQSGRVCGRLYPLEEHVKTRYVKVKDVGGETVFLTKRAQDWRVICSARHPKFGFSICWYGIGEIDGKTLAIHIGRYKQKNKLFLFDKDELEVNPEAYEESAENDLGALILEVLNRH